MNPLSDNVNRLQPSATLAMTAKSMELQAQGIDVITLSVGEPDFPTPTHIKEAGKKAIDDGWTRYSPGMGYMDLRQAIVRKLQRENGLDYKPEQIVVSNGAKQSVCNAIMALAGAGDEVLIPAPYWVSYPQMVLLSGATPVVIPTTFESGFKVTPEQLEAAITPRTKAIVFCSPSNPTGAVYTQAEFNALAQVLQRHTQVFVIADEIYEHINYLGTHASMAKSPDMLERTVIINGVSKAYAMTGWRIGFMAGPVWLAKACNKLQGQYTSGPCSVSQKAALVAFDGPQECVETMRQAFQRRRDLIVSLAKQVPGFEVNVPDGAFYIFPKCNALFGKKNGRWTIANSTDLAMYLLEYAHVSTVGGDAFGDPDCIRLSYATSEANIEEAMRRIKKVIEELA
ncbi:MAG: pyridoxal phosphate-dependent aminotransferase [Alloprevotella sp.]|nr:pyridoxal phosphate-dependent aminotransferase [Alloprevotella sp.]